MARNVFFSFHYKNDVWRANQIRNLGIVIGQAAAGFKDASLWEEAKKEGDAAIKKLIDAALVGTTVTVVLIGSETANRKYVKYEIDKSNERGNGLLGIFIHELEDQNGNTCAKGAVPKPLSDAGAPSYNWDQDKFAGWVEAAAKKVGK